MPKAVERHVEALGFRYLNAYFEWCRANGFAGIVQKSKADLQAERDAFDAQAARRQRHGRLHKNPRAFLEAVCAGDLIAEDIDRPNFKAVAVAVQASAAAPAARKSLFDMLLWLSRIDDLPFQTAPGPDGAPFIIGLVKLHDRKALWLRQLEDWKPKSKNQDRRFGELTHHLFDRFGDVPRFMERVWLRTDRASWRYRDWFVHLGRGFNLRTAKTPAPLTKKMAHHFLLAPDDYSIEQAVRWGQLRAFGGGENAVHAVVATRLGRSFEHEAFWITVLRFIADNPMLDPRQIGPIIDYLHNQRFEPIEMEVAPGQWRREPPAQPRLSMKGRTVESLLRQTAEWHESLGRLRQMGGGLYKQAAFGGFDAEREAGGKTVRWTIRQLRTAEELRLESAELRHCVASYHWSCAHGHCTIWSLAASISNGVYERRQTIEVDKNLTILQCRGFANKDPSAEEFSIVSAWARETGLKITTRL